MTIHFSSSILKINSAGKEVLSSTLEEGESMASGATYAELQGTPAAPEDKETPAEEPAVEPAAEPAVEPETTPDEGTKKQGIFSRGK